MASRPVISCACRHDGGRSVAGKVLAEHYAGDRALVRSAGSEPGDAVNPAVVQVLQERRLSTAGEHPKLLAHDTAEGSDVVIGMACGETCSVFPGQRCEDWVLEDPEGKDIETVRGILDDIDGPVRALLCHLGVDVPADAR